MMDGFLLKGKHALLIQPENLGRLDAAISRVLVGRELYENNNPSHSWTIWYDNDSARTNLSLDELLESPNRDGSRIISLSVSSSAGYPLFKLRFNSLDTWEGSAFVEDAEAELSHFKSQVSSEIAQMKPWYSWFARTSLASIFFAAVVANTALNFKPPESNIVDEFVALGTRGRFILLGCFAVILVGFVWIMERIERLKQKYVLPMFLVTIDGGARLHEVASTLRRWVLAPAILLPTLYALIDFLG